VKEKQTLVNRKLRSGDRQLQIERDILKKAEANLVDERMRQHLSVDFTSDRHSNLCFDMQWDEEPDRKVRVG